MTGSAAAMIALASLIVAFAACGDEASDGSLAYPALPAPPLVAPAPPLAPASPDPAPPSQRHLELCRDTVVANPSSNPGLVEDCANLLGGLEILDPSGALNWGMDTAISDWNGIELGGSPSRVIALNLESNALSGSIPPELGNLAGLEALNLRETQLTGNVPPELGNLAGLEVLNLKLNQLTGNVPPHLGNLIDLEQLCLWANQLTGGIPPELGNLINLRKLTFRENQLSGDIPPELGNLVNLNELDLSYNGGS